MKEVTMWTIDKNKSWAHLHDHYYWISRMDNVPQSPIHHAEGNVGIHTRMVVEALMQLPAWQQLPPQQQELLWAAALLHDVEKFSTTETLDDGSIVSPGHARRGAMTARNILFEEIPTPFAIREQISWLIRYHGLPLWVFDKPDPVKALISASLDVDTAMLATLARADVLGRICNDQEELLYRIDCFEALAREQQCWGQPKAFETAAAKMNYLTKEEVAPDYVPFPVAGSEVILMSGLPGAGKDTYVQRNYKEWAMVSPDNLRREKKVDPTDKSANGTIIQEAKEQARAYLRAGKNFVWNATNITRQMRQQLVSLCMTYHAHVTIVYVEVPADKLLKQNAQRKYAIPEKALRQLMRKLEVPGQTEAHEVTYVV
ncbi:Predicted kinase [Chitinophaga jiangningensis]|uniref:Predicted kinase n=1 Tax=Chitinophaga jiangningensis TaxID=1419482 RepID=A0A1M6YPS3_9BACT|nr:AAA family ATPase [Chitinophaga jiangningensis]SHL20256.1 Predicted kinase [Chitinophaga jiangningensis]